MSRAEASRKSARRVAGFPGGLAQQVRQASRVEEPLGDSQESESESASETGAQGGRAVKLNVRIRFDESIALPILHLCTSKIRPLWV